MNCQARKGFLTLSECDNPAARACANCGRSFCPSHLSPPAFSMCLDCAAVDPEAQSAQEEHEGEYDGVWAHRYRSSYYASTGYTASHSLYDGNDYSSFDESRGDALDDDTTGGGFGES
jgi:hypothetical protein